MKRYIFQNVTITTFYRDRQISFQTDEWRFISALVTSNLEFFAAHKKSYLIACSFYMKGFMKKGTPIKNKKKVEFDKKSLTNVFTPCCSKHCVSNTCVMACDQLRDFSIINQWYTIVQLNFLPKYIQNIEWLNYIPH